MPRNIQSNVGVCENKVGVESNILGTLPMMLMRGYCEGALWLWMALYVLVDCEWACRTWLSFLQLCVVVEFGVEALRASYRDSIVGEIVKREHVTLGRRLQVRTCSSILIDAFDLSLSRSTIILSFKYSY